MLMIFSSTIIHPSSIFNLCLVSFVLSAEIIRAERLHVVDLTSRSAVLQWRPVLGADGGYYELWYKPKSRTDPEIRRTLTGDSSRAQLKNLQPETTYTAFLRPEFNQELLNTLTVTFTTFPGKNVCGLYNTVVPSWHITGFLWSAETWTGCGAGEEQIHEHVGICT